MIEYLYDAIRAHAGNDLVISAEITDVLNEPIVEKCVLWLHDKDKETMIAEIKGQYSEEEGWTFTIPAELTEGLEGRYWYCIRHEGTSLCFKQPIYLV